MALSLKVHHLPRYKNIATLLVKQWRADELKDFDPADPARDGTATADDGRQLADGLESMGPTFVTLGQLLSTRADLLPPAYLEALSRLQDGVQPVRRLWCCEQPASEISRGRHRTVCQGQRCCASFSCRWFDGFARRWRWLFAPGSSGPLNPNPPASPPPGGNSSSTGTGGSKAESTHETTDGLGRRSPS